MAALALLASTLGSVAPRAADHPEVKLGKFIAAASPQPAPQIFFTDLAGGEASLADFKGKLVLVNLWATWCQPCLKEMPALESLQTKLGSALSVLAISEDRGGATAVEPFIKKLGLDKVKIYLDPKSTAIKALAARGLPTSVVIDGEGRVLGRVEGAAKWDSDEMLDILTKLVPVNSPVNSPGR